MQIPYSISFGFDYIPFSYQIPVDVHLLSWTFPQLNACASGHISTFSTELLLDVAPATRTLSVLNTRDDLHCFAHEQFQKTLNNLAKHLVQLWILSGILAHYVLLCGSWSRLRSKLKLHISRYAFWFPKFTFPLYRPCKNLILTFARILQNKK